ncbi:MAG: TonB-dependent receptor [Panacagrimonas sp.]
MRFACRFLLTLTLLPAAYAEEGVAPAVPADSAVVLDTIIVTARKREDPLHEVPESVAVVNGEVIEQRGLDTIGDLDSQVANLQVSDANGVRTIYMRGAGGGGRTVGFDPRTGVYVDGVYLGFPPSANSMLVDLDRVEVLRGPQGLLFGQNTVSGALNLITRAPAETFGVRSMLSYGRRNAGKFAGSVDAPLIADRLFARASVALAQRDGFVDNVFDGSRVDEGDEAAGRLRLRYKLSPTAVFDLAADRARQATQRPTGEAFTNTAGTGPADPPRRYTVNLDTPQRDVNENGGVSGTYDWKGMNLEITSISAYRSARREWIVDLDYSPRDINTLDYDDRYRVLSQEVRVLVQQPGLGLSGLAGIYVFDSDAESDRLVNAGEDVKQFPPFAMTLSSGDTVLTRADVRTRAYAVFGSLGYEPALRWRFEGGLRATHTSKDLEYDQTPSSGYSAIPGGPARVQDFGDEFGETAITPEGSVRFLVSEQESLYARYARGFKNGGFDADLARSQPTRFDQETVDSYEIGVKTLWFDRRLRVDFDVFLADYRDYQVTQFVPSGTFFLPVTTNAGEVRTWGPELSLSARPLHGLNLSLDAAWLRAEYEEFRNGAVVAGVPQDYSGKRTEFSPKWTLVTAVDYRRPLPWRERVEGLAGADFSCRSRYYTQPSNDARLHADSRSLLNARLGLTARGGRFESVLYLDNALDDRHYDSLNRGTLGAFYGRLGDPRTYGVRFRIDTN